MVMNPMVEAVENHLKRIQVYEKIRNSLTAQWKALSQPNQPSKKSLQKTNPRKKSQQKSAQFLTQVGWLEQKDHPPVHPPSQRPGGFLRGDGNHLGQTVRTR